MMSTLTEDLFFYQKVKIKRRYSNPEIFLYQYFWKKTRIRLENIVIIGNYIFFFVGGKDYFKAKIYLKQFRDELKKKVVVLRYEDTLIKLIFSFFPDPYIHQISFGTDIYKGKRIINVGFISFSERGIAVGRQGEYIKTVNKILERYVLFEDYPIPIILKCNLVDF